MTRGMCGTLSTPAGKIDQLTEWPAGILCWLDLEDVSEQTESHKSEDCLLFLYLC
jgi:hypothetical protein